MIDISKVRLDTPFADGKIFFNSAGSSLSPSQVTHKVIEYLRKEEKIGGYAMAALHKEEINACYQEAARLINAEPPNVALAVSATDAYIKALSSIAFKNGDVIVTTNDDYISNQIHFLSLQNQLGVVVHRVENLENGDLNLTHFEMLIAEHKPKLVAVTHIPTSSGVVQPVEVVGDLCEKYGVLYLVDACQSVGQWPIDVTKIKCDFLSATGRKFLRGPRGTGFLYVSDRILNGEFTPLFIDMRGADWIDEDQYQVQPTARRYELWEWQYGTVVGLAEAIRYANEVGIDHIHQRNQTLLKRLTDGLSTIPSVRQFDRGSLRSNIVTCQKEGKSEAETTAYLKKHNVYFSVAEISSARIDFPKKGIDWAIRLSPHYFNTEEEVDELLNTMDSL